MEAGKFTIHVNGAQVATSERGGSFGELALVMDQLRAATVTAAEDSLCWQLDRKPFRQFMAASTASELVQITEGLRNIELLAGLSEDSLAQLALPPPPPPRWLSCLGSQPASGGIAAGASMFTMATPLIGVHPLVPGLASLVRVLLSYQIFPLRPYL